MNKGLLYVVFGDDYDALAAHTVAHTRRFTDLPVRVLTNIVKRNKKWKGIKDVEFKYLSLERKDNRDVRTKMIKYSPFDLTLCMDCDNVVQRDGMEEIFRLLENGDALLSVDMNWKKGDKILSIYKRMMKQTNVGLPITIYHGGLQLFRKNERVYNFFNLWNKYWKLSGMGRDMPAFNCAVKNSGVIVKSFSVKDNIYSAERKSDKAIIQHRYTGDFSKRFELPKWKPWKPFNGVKNRKDFSWVEF